MSVDTDRLQFRQLDLAGVRTLVDWAREEGWNPGPHDAEVFRAADPEGFYGFHCDDRLIAGGSIVSYGGNFGFMGLFIVKPEFRSRGIGNSLWYRRRDALLARLEPGAAIGMDGVLAMQPFYSKGGFKIAFRDERYETRGASFAIDSEVSRIEAGDFDAVLDYDTRCFGFRRPRFLEPWLELPLSRAFKWVDDDGLKGFAVLRKAANGYKIGPLFADDARVAEALYKACLNAAQNDVLYLDIPVANADAVELVAKYGGRYVFECARMYHGRPPAIDIDKVFGITTFELG